MQGNISKKNVECASVTGYLDLVSNNEKVIPIKLIETKDNQHAIIFYSHKKKVKKIYKAIYDLEENKIGDLQLISSIESKSKRQTRHSGYIVYQSQNKEFTAVLERDFIPGGLFGKTKGFINYALLDEDLKLLKQYETESKYYFFITEVFSTKVFQEANFMSTDQILTNEGTFFQIHFLHTGDYVVFTCQKDSDVMTQYEIDGEEYSKDLPIINKNNPNEIELWSIAKHVKEPKFDLVIESGKDGNNLDLTVIPLPRLSNGNPIFQKNDRYLHISSINNTANAESYFTLAPMKNQATTRTTPHEFKVEGLFIFKLKNNKTTLIYQERHKAKILRRKSNALRDSPFLWSTACNRKILYSYIMPQGNLRDPFDHKHTYDIKMIALDLNNDEILNIELQNSKPFKRWLFTEPIIPTVYNKFDFLFNEEEECYLIFPGNSQEIF